MAQMMKWILFLLPTMALASDYIPEIRFQQASDFVEISDSDSGRNNPDKSWSIYLSDDCNLYDRNVQNENELRKTGLRRCKDGSISFVQPKSDGWNGWEGKCGQTAASNSLYHLCKTAMNPDVYVSRYLSDVTPGVRPKTLRRGLRGMFLDLKTSCPKSNSNNWKYSHTKTLNNYIAHIKQDIFPKYSHVNLLKVTRDGKTYFRNPVLSLIQNPGGKYLHWVSIIDIISNINRCDFVVNHWDNQYIVPCATFASWAQKVGKTYPIILKSFSTVTFK